jgi:hypothetical protein
MKLSDAIRIGAAKRPQAFGNYISKEPGGAVCTCALGAAYEGITGTLPPFGLTLSALGDTFRALAGIDLETEVAPPDGNFNYAVGLDSAVITLNDGAHWSREQIADWLQGIGL